MTLKVFRFFRVFIAVGYYLLIAFPLVVSADPVSQLTLQWEVNTPAPDGYNLFQRVEDGSYNYDAPVNQSLITGTTYTVENLQQGVRYYFTLRSVENGDMSGDSNEVSFMDPIELVDTDGDGYIDSIDAFPSDDTEWLDTDEDGVGNNADSDDDGDGMPDDFETQYDLDPLVDDASGDLDGDGIDNLTEYTNGTDPGHVQGNISPGQPELISPANGEEDIMLTPALISDGFEDQDGDSHAKTQYQVAVGSDWDNLDDDDFVFDGVFENHLTSLSLVDLILEPETVYFWRVRYIDSRNGASQWSATSMFETTDSITAGYLDDDGDGILDSQEVGNGDVNLGVDPSEDLMVIGSSDSSNPQLGILLSANADVVSLRAPDASGIDDLNAPAILTGLISFKLSLRDGETTAYVTVYLSQPAPEGALWYKYSMDDGWAPYDDVTFSPDRQSVTILLVDGGQGDDDGVRNGLIVDPSGLGYSSNGSGSSLGYSSQTSDVSSSSETAGGGCFISVPGNEPIENFGHALYLLILGLFILAIMLCMKRHIQRANQ